MTNAWLVFMLPYSIIAFSIGTPYSSQLSEHAAAGRDADVIVDIRRSTRRLKFFLVRATAAVLAAAIPASRMFTNSPADAVQASTVLLCYSVGLVPVAVLFIVQRTVYAYGDTRTPFLFTILQCSLVALTASAAWALNEASLLPSFLLVETVTLGQSIAGTVQTIVAVTVLRNRPPLEVKSWMQSLVRFASAAVSAAPAAGDPSP